MLVLALLSAFVGDMLSAENAVLVEDGRAGELLASLSCKLCSGIADGYLERRFSDTGEAKMLALLGVAVLKSDLASAENVASIGVDFVTRCFRA